MNKWATRKEAMGISDKQELGVKEQGKICRQKGKLSSKIVFFKCSKNQKNKMHN
jgi:hypothetical protein